jgi:imidazolonepropionase-like amidohydrolase
VVIDAGGMTAIPGLIDSHVHITFGDYTPRQRTVGYLESYLHGGTTTAISASEVHVPAGRAIRRASKRWRLRRSAASPATGRAACASLPAR